VITELFKVWPDSPWLFPSRKAKHLSRHTLDWHHERIREKHGLPLEWVVYSCRHTFGTRLAESGAQAYEIQRLMGHTNIKTSMKYIHLSEDYLSLAMKRKEVRDQALRGEKPLHFPELSEAIR